MQTNKQKRTHTYRHPCMKAYWPIIRRKKNKIVEGDQLIEDSSSRTQKKKNHPNIHLTELTMKAELKYIYIYINLTYIRSNTLHLTSC